MRRQLRRGVRVFTAGAPPAAATIERMESDLGWEITHVYGLTETAPFISICEPLPEHAALSGADRAILKARQGVELITSGELRVVDDDMRDVPRDGATLGEMIARGNVVMRGYYNDPEATASAFRGGWFHSGDAAVVHPDGYIEIRDRFKDVIISGGENISSIEVEGALLRHPAILEAAVVGMPHEKWGETPHAFVVLRADASATEAELHDFARGTLAHFKVPSVLSFRERAAEDRDRKNPEVRAARQAARNSAAVTGGRMENSSNDLCTHPPLFSAEFQRDPYPTYRHYLAGPSLQPLAGRPGTWLLFGYEACAAVIRDPRLSAVRPASLLVAVSGEALAEFEDLVRHMQRWLLLQDAPRHSELRKLMNRGFTPVVVGQLKEKVNAIIERLLDDMQSRESIDLIRDFAYPLPVRVICELLGLPEELHDRCVVLSNDIALWMGDLRRPPERARLAQCAIRELEGYFSQTIRERRGARKNDLLSLLLDAADEAGVMTEEELYAQCVMLLFGGHETTRNLIGNGITRC